MTRPLLGCTMGDPAGIGPEVALRACEDGPGAAVDAGGVLLLGDAAHLADLARRLGIDGEPAEVTGVGQAREGLEAGEAGPWVLSCARVEPGLRLGRPRPEDGGTALDCVARGAELAESGAIDALVTAPLSKDVVAAREPRFMGHTEYLATRAGIRHPVMLFAGPRPHVALLTTHLPLATALALIRRRRVAAMLERLDRHWADAFGRRPRIGVAALNPHAGEEGRLGTEEARELAPAVIDAREAGIDATGPFAADSIFLRPRLDVVLALYHNQGTIMVKRHPEPTVNVTLGLPYVRTSPDHGTAYDLAPEGTASDAAMRAALDLAARLARRRTSVAS